MDTATIEQRLEDIKLEVFGPAISLLLIDIVGEGVVIKEIKNHPYDDDDIVYIGIPDVPRAVTVNIDSILIGTVDVDVYDMTLADLESDFNEGYIPAPTAMNLQKYPSYKDTFYEIIRILRDSGIPLRIN